MTGDRPQVIVCGLGPGGPGLITAETQNLLDSNRAVFLRTARHPSAAVATGAKSFDHFYDQAETFHAVYDRIAQALADHARNLGSVVYAVPGSPLVLEESVRRLRRVSMADPVNGIDVQVLAAMSFLDVAWAALGVDPVDDGVRLVDGHRFTSEAAGERGPLLVAHVHADWVLSSIKLSVEFGPQRPVTVLQRLGTPEQHVFEVTWNELDRIEADHLTSLFIPEMAVPVGAELSLSIEMMDRLRLQCPWDRRQDHGTLRKYLREETYEVLDALDGVVGAGVDDAATAYDELESELGDLWFQILFHCRLAAEQGHFTVADVARTLTEKMVERHPHVFDPAQRFDGRNLPEPPSSRDPVTDTDLGDDSSMARTWEAKKAEQSRRQSTFDGIPGDLPSLALADKVLGKAVRLFGQPELGPTVASVRSVLTGGDRPDPVDALGGLALALAWEARTVGVDLEHVLRAKVGEVVAEMRQREATAESPRDGNASGGETSGRWVVG